MKELFKSLNIDINELEDKANKAINEIFLNSETLFKAKPLFAGINTALNNEISSIMKKREQKSNQVSPIFHKNLYEITQHYSVFKTSSFKDNEFNNAFNSSYKKREDVFFEHKNNQANLSSYYLYAFSLTYSEGYQKYIISSITLKNKHLFIDFDFIKKHMSFSDKTALKNYNSMIKNDFFIGVNLLNDQIKINHDISCKNEVCNLIYDIIKHITNKKELYSFLHFLFKSDSFSPEEKDLFSIKYDVYLEQSKTTDKLVNKVLSLEENFKHKKLCQKNKS